ncbi:FHA domain-containing protein [Candidatus Fermentibacteria bacterium]|nr:FHA domain-containing protein [Candidatus Fermentibacteria bacterium]
MTSSDTLAGSQGWTLHILHGPAAVREYPLDPSRSYTIGRREHSGEWRPDLDLFPDTSVSRRHARFGFTGGAWFVEDTGSKGGTRVDGREIQGISHPTTILPGVTVQMGETTWVISPSDVHCATWHEMGIRLRMIPTLTYSLHHCSIPVITALRLENLSPDVRGPLRITITIPGYSYPCQLACEEIPGKSTREFGEVPLRLRYEQLEGQVGRRRATVEVALDDEVALVQGIDILGFHEWPLHTAYRKSLACFVQPAHPSVTSVAAEAMGSLQMHELASASCQGFRILNGHGIREILKALYTTLRDRYDIKYVPPDPGSESGSQTIRPPHRVMAGQRGRQGEGTCIDLALFLASVLEHVNVQPVVVVLRGDHRWYHAVVGCWTTVSPRVEPVISDVDRLNRELARSGIMLLEPTGLTDRYATSSGRKLTFEEALVGSSTPISRDAFVFALDIAAARQTVTPLHMPLDPEALRVIRSAERRARAERAERLETGHLLAALVDEDLEHVQAVLRKVGASPADLPSSRDVPDTAFQPIPVPTVNYRRCLEDARIAAEDCGVTFLGPEHLFYAVLQSRSASVDLLSEHMGTTRQEVLRAFLRQFLWTADLVETCCE